MFSTPLALLARTTITGSSSVGHATAAVLSVGGGRQWIALPATLGGSRLMATVCLFSACSVVPGNTSVKRSATVLPAPQAAGTAPMTSPAFSANRASSCSQERLDRLLKRPCYATPPVPLVSTQMTTNSNVGPVHHLVPPAPPLPPAPPVQKVGSQSMAFAHNRVLLGSTSMSLCNTASAATPPVPAVKIAPHAPAVLGRCFLMMMGTVSTPAPNTQSLTRPWDAVRTLLAIGRVPPVVVRSPVTVSPAPSPASCTNILAWSNVLMIPTLPTIPVPPVTPPAPLVVDLLPPTVTVVPMAAT